MIPDKILRSCYVRDLPEDIYHADALCPVQSLSHSMAKQLLAPAGPAKWKYARDRGVREVKKEWDLGSAVHTLVLGTGYQVAIIPDELLSGDSRSISSRVAKQWVADARSRGEIPLKSDEYAVAQDMAASVQSHPRAAELLHGVPELSGFARVDGLGEWLRCRYDLHNDLGGVDLKTTTNADPDAFNKRAADYGYTLQDAIYRWVDRLLGHRDPTFTFVQVETEPPYLCSFVTLSGELREWGDEQARKALELWHQCRTTDTWPGYPNEVVEVSDLPGYLRGRQPARLVDVKEAAALVGCSETTIRRRIDDGTLDAELVGGRWRVPDRQLTILGVQPRALRTTESHTPAELDPDLESELLTLLEGTPA